MIWKKRTTRLGLAILAAVSLLPAAAAAQSLRGVIVDQNTGEPVANARVLIFRPGGDGVMYGVRADSRGGFDAADAIRDGGFQAGEHVVINIMARGYQLYEERITLPRSAEEDEYRLRPISSANERTANPRQIWIEMWLIEASGKNGAKAEYPEEIEPVVENLKPLFRFNRYRIIGRADGMGMEGSTLVFQSDPGRSSGGRFEAAATIGFGNGFIKLPELNVHVQEPQHKALNTSLNIPDGEMVILGASSGAVVEGSLISVIRARFLDSPGSNDDRDHP